ncbi:MAG: phosphatase PAP2 family protein [Sphingopyxis sp.]|nr:phosphatase PAP2 family protein [Sphingopyxis sp.]
MQLKIGKAPVEIVIAGAMLLTMLLFSAAFDLPIVYPTSSRAAEVGIHYIFPVLGVGLLGLVIAFAGDREVATKFLLATPCYVVVLFAHFNIKLWIPHINSVSYDSLYWQTDVWAAPLIFWCIEMRKSILWLIPFEANFYMISFVVLFYCSFLYHAIKTPGQFGKLMVAVLLLQSLGTFAYLIAPAVGPFIFETGINPMVTTGQHAMLDFHRGSVNHGPDWIAQHGGAQFTAGLAAMPSLHSAGAFLFFLFAWQHGKILAPLYSLILLFILVTAVASRWHYLIDVPAGVALAWVAYRLADYLTQRKDISEDADRVIEGQAVLT